MIALRKPHVHPLTASFPVLDATMKLNLALELQGFQYPLHPTTNSINMVQIVFIRRVELSHSDVNAKQERGFQGLNPCDRR